MKPGRGRGISRCKLWPRLSVEGGLSLESQRRAAPERVCPHTQGIRWGFLRSLRACMCLTFFSAFPWTANSHAQFLVLNKNSRNPACSSRSDIWTYWTASVVFPSLHGQGTHVQSSWVSLHVESMSFHMHPIGNWASGEQHWLWVSNMPFGLSTHLFLIQWVRLAQSRSRRGSCPSASVG